YLALTFGTLLSSQGTDASFVLTPEHSPRLSSGRFPSVFPTLPRFSEALDQGQYEHTEPDPVQGSSFWFGCR
ncbi:hypothetical protein, partial [Streptomyces sp. GC420]|uniref:hypothetical protein n=1 Tax=Streptomyces sp. GC420 TaxID=2697568 RepID=UPI001AA16F34